MNKIIENLGVIYADYFLQNGEEKGFEILRFKVIVSILYNIYQSLIADGLEPIENISQEKKWQYYKISGKYYDRKEQRIKASKAAYVLELITSNF